MEKLIELINEYVGGCPLTKKGVFIDTNINVVYENNLNFNH